MKRWSKIIVIASLITSAALLLQLRSKLISNEKLSCGNGNKTFKFNNQYYNFGFCYSEDWYINADENTNGTSVAGGLGNNKNRKLDPGSSTIIFQIGDTPSLEKVSELMSTSKYQQIVDLRESNLLKMVVIKNSNREFAYMARDYSTEGQLKTKITWYIKSKQDESKTYYFTYSYSEASDPVAVYERSIVFNTIIESFKEY